MNSVSSSSDVSVGLPEVVAHAKSYGFIYPSSVLYDHLQAVYDYGPYGALLKGRLCRYWLESMTRLHANIVALDSAILMHARVWAASGHVAHFHDLFVEHKTSHKRYRLDVLVEERALEYAANGHPDKATALRHQFSELMQAGDKAQLGALLKTHEVVCAVAKTSDWSPVRELKLMFSTQSNTDASEHADLYLRPETAQGVYVNFEHVQKSLRMKVPFGIAQIGKAFRNELIARQFTFRMREFEQMELQYFIPPDTHDEWFAYWRKARLRWYECLGMSSSLLRVHPHETLAHYARCASDIEYRFPFGWREIEGIHARGDFDLSAHSQHAGRKLTYYDETTKTHYIPHVLETSAGLDRIVLMLLCHGYRKQNGRLYLALPPALAPVQLAIFPLVRKDGLPEKAQEIVRALKAEFETLYEESASIGKRYARQDLIGTPYCVTVDHQTLEDDTVTLRERDSTKQHRLPIQALRPYLAERVHITALLNQL